jgi:1,4-alpha-glucan branching enzyme
MSTISSHGTQTVLYDGSLLTDHDIYLFKEGSHFKLHHKLGAHSRDVAGVRGTHFALWAPNAEWVSVIGDFNGWNRASHPLKARADASGLWEGFIAGIGHGTIYKYHIVSRYHNYKVDKADPFAFRMETPPKTRPSCGI